ncbi:MAG: helix-turn-helix transcriptional regulator [Oscillospiraceae bacterium]|nr:helix-turn-helix transcriptional regulator [Oscillospiraceae bacterium]
MSNFSERLLALRKERKLNQEEVVAEFDLSIRSYRRYETGKGEPTLSTLWKIADFYGVSVDYLIGRSEER